VASWGHTSSGNGLLLVQSRPIIQRTRAPDSRLLIRICNLPPPSMRSLENGVSSILKCHFAGFAVQVQVLEVVTSAKPGPSTSPKAADYDVETVKKESYRTTAEIAYNRFGTGVASQPDALQPVGTTSKMVDTMLQARKKIIDSLKESTAIVQLGDLFPDSRFKGLVMPGVFPPIFFEYILPKSTQLKAESTKKLHFVYNGRFLIVAAHCDPGSEIPGLPETVSEVCLQMSKSGLEFRWLSPTSAFPSLYLGHVSLYSSPTPAVLNDYVGGAGAGTRALTSAPRSVQGALRTLYATSFQYMMSFYSLKEESETEEALILTIESHRKTILDLMHEFNQTKGRQLLRRRELRRLIRDHCFNLTEKIGRVDTLSDSIALGIASLDAELQHEPDLRPMLEREPSWKDQLHHEFDTKPVLDMIARTSDEVNRDNMGQVIIWVALLAGAVGGLVGYLVSRIV